VSLASNLPSGYNRDFQDLKKPLIESIELTVSCLNIAMLLLQNLSPNEDQLVKTMTSELFATHMALEKVAKGTPFRTAYQETAHRIGQLKNMTKTEMITALKKSIHIGGTGNLGLVSLKKTINKENAQWAKARKKFDDCLESLKGGE
jgi:argininosuccinate lyase